MLAVYLQISAIEATINLNNWPDSQNTCIKLMLITGLLFEGNYQYFEAICEMDMYYFKILDILGYCNCVHIV